jgi:hypothetical protein
MHPPLGPAFYGFVRSFGSGPRLSRSLTRLTFQSLRQSVVVVDVTCVVGRNMNYHSSSDQARELIQQQVNHQALHREESINTTVQHNRCYRIYKYAVPMT